jgi:nicotinamidase-related amidase
MERTTGGLIERERSCLIVVDVQQYFLDKLPPHERGPLVQRMAWLMRVARALDIPSPPPKTSSATARWCRTSRACWRLRRRRSTR